MKAVGNDASLRSYPQLVAGIHPKGNQDGFPITHVGNDLSGHLPQIPDLSGYFPQIAGMSSEVLLNKKKEVG